VTRSRGQDVEPRVQAGQRWLCDQPYRAKQKETAPLSVIRVRQHCAEINIVFTIRVESSAMGV